MDVPAEVDERNCVLPSHTQWYVQTLRVLMCDHLYIVFRMRQGSATKDWQCCSSNLLLMLPFAHTVEYDTRRSKHARRPGSSLVMAYYYAKALNFTGCGILIKSQRCSSLTSLSAGSEPQARRVLTS